MKYYAFLLWNENRSCTIGLPNKQTGRLSIAGDLEVFRTKSDRRNWLCAHNARSIAVTKKHARKLLRGLSIQEFNQYIENQEYARYEM